MILPKPATARDMAMQDPSMWEHVQHVSNRHPVCHS
jgi:hypothetical protein